MFKDWFTNKHEKEYQKILNEFINEPAQNESIRKQESINERFANLNKSKKSIKEESKSLTYQILKNNLSSLPKPISNADQERLPLIPKQKAIVESYKEKISKLGLSYDNAWSYCEQAINEQLYLEEAPPISKKQFVAYLNEKQLKPHKPVNKTVNKTVNVKIEETLYEAPIKKTKSTKGIKENFKGKIRWVKHDYTKIALYTILSYLGFILFMMFMFYERSNQYDFILSFLTLIPFFFLAKYVYKKVIKHKWNQKKSLVFSLIFFLMLPIFYIRDILGADKSYDCCNSVYVEMKYSNGKLSYILSHNIVVDFIGRDGFSIHKINAVKTGKRGTIKSSLAQYSKITGCECG